MRRCVVVVLRLKSLVGTHRTAQRMADALLLDYTPCHLQSRPAAFGHPELLTILHVQCYQPLQWLRNGRETARSTVTMVYRTLCTPRDNVRAMPPALVSRAKVLRHSYSWRRISR